METERKSEFEKKCDALECLRHARSLIAKAVRARDFEAASIYLKAEEWALRELAENNHVDC